MFNPFKAFFNKNQQAKLSNAKYRYLFEPPPTNEWVCLDLELTGLNPKTDHILSIGAVKIKKHNIGFTIDVANPLSVICRPPIMPDTKSIVIHGLRPMDLQNGATYDTMLNQLLPFIGSRPIVGFYVGMDVAFLNAIIKPKIGIKLPNTLIDVSTLDVKLRHKLHKNSDIPIDKRHLNELLNAYHMPILPAHDSMNDALMTAMLFCHLNHQLSRSSP